MKKFLFLLLIATSLFSSLSQTVFAKEIDIVFQQHVFEKTSAPDNVDIKNYLSQIEKEISLEFQNPEYSNFHGTFALYIEIDNQSKKFTYDSLSNDNLNDKISFDIQTIKRIEFNPKNVKSSILILYRINQHLITKDEIKYFQNKKNI